VPALTNGAFFAPADKKDGPVGSQLPPRSMVIELLQLTRRAKLDGAGWRPERQSINQHYNTTLWRFTMNKKFASVAATVIFATVSLPGFAADSHDSAKQGQSRIEREVRHELLTLGPYGVFDNLSYRVEGTKVTLFGAVTQPVIKLDAVTAVKGVEGVTSVNDQIEVLPVSSMDDQIRRAVYRAIYGDAGLSRYSFQAIPSIHIIVKNGNVTLEGVVANKGDSDLANLRANSVGGLFSVTNNLRVDAGH
jgi:hyperosmotically inducible protein